MAPLMTGCRTSPGVRRCFRPLLDDLAFEQDLDLIADDQLAIEHHAERHPKVLAVDLALAAMGDAIAHHQIVERAKSHDVQRDQVGHALDGRIADYRVAILVNVFNPRTLPHKLKATNL
jgi:hypothetical protein